MIGTRFTNKSANPFRHREPLKIVSEVNVKDVVQKIVRLLARAMNVSSASLCFCGVGKLYGECCENAAPDKLAFSENQFEIALKYRDSQGGQISSLPAGIANQFLEKGIKKLRCLYPGCTAKPVACHL